MFVVFYYDNRPVHASFPPTEAPTTSQALEWAKNSPYMSTHVTRIGVYDLESYLLDESLVGKRSPCDTYILGLVLGDNFGLINLFSLSEVNAQKEETPNLNYVAVPVYPDRHCLDMIGGPVREEADVIIAEALAGVSINE